MTHDKRSVHKISGQLHWSHWCVIALSLLLTFGAWYFTSQQVAQKNQARFEFQAQQIIELVHERMSKYEETLWSGVAALDMYGPAATRDDWARFANSLEIEKRFPGINGIGVIHYVPPEKLPDYLDWQRQVLPGYAIHPAHEEAEFWPITYIEPISANLKAVGLDMAHETNRFTAAKKTRDTQKANITGPIILVQDAQKTPGFLFYVPWYANAKVPEEFGDAESQFLGLVYAPFIMHKLMDGTLDNTNRQVNFSIHDGEYELYNELNVDSADYDANPLLSTDFSIDLYGRSWDFHIQTSQIFRQQNSHSQPMVILIGGLTIDALLLLIFVLMARANRHAVSYADKITADLQTRQLELEKTQANLEHRNAELTEANTELDQFTFVASHDLKAPLRGIAQLASWIEDDLQDKLTPETTEYLRLLQNRITRLDKLLNDLLIYSRVGRKHGDYETFRVISGVQELFDLNNAEKNIELVCSSEEEQFVTLVVPLQIIIRNLIGNALKHHDQDTGVIKFQLKTYGDFYEISIEDDGPGIPTEHHSRVFDLFHTLKPRDEMEGSGMGLAIIKKILERYKGSYVLESDGVRGCSFRFFWPKEEKLREIVHE